MCTSPRAVYRTSVTRQVSRHFPAATITAAETAYCAEMDGEGTQRFATEAQAAEWDARYCEREGAMWSGRPNGRLLAEVADLAPGRALDVGCGEGADAIWLARHGWTVTAVDISAVALGRAREAAASNRVEVEWVCGD